MDDNTQLRQFVEAGSQEAFRELVGRHTDLVYACAMQRLRDTHAAQDVTQAVFLTLALKAKDLRSHTSLAGWLFTTTRYVATRYQRGEQRRKEREMRTFEESQIAEAGTTTEAAWDEVQPHLAGALDSLSSADREAVLLRFYRKASHQEVATALGTSEDGARKRVDRALDKLRRFFTNKGVALSATALAGALTANAAQAAPAGLAATAGATALAGAGGTLTATSTLVLAKGAIQMMFIAQLKTAALITAACVVVAGSGVIVAKEVLVQSATPATAQAEQKGPPSAMATNVAATVETASLGRSSADSGSVAAFGGAQQVSKRVRAYLYARSDGERTKHEWVLFLVEKDETPPNDEKYEVALRVDEAEITAVETWSRIYLWAYDFASGSVWLNHYNDDAPPGNGAARNKYSMANGRVFCLSDSGTVAQVRVERALLDEVFARQPQRRTNIVPGKPWIRVSLNDEGAFYRELFATLRKQHLSIDRFLQRPEGLSREQDPDVRLYGQKIPFQAQGNTNELPHKAVAGTNDAATSLFPRPTPLPRPAPVQRLSP